LAAVSGVSPRFRGKTSLVSRPSGVGTTFASWVVVQTAVEGFLVARRYALGRKIGSGGMGTVWLAHDQSLDRVCALKILDPDKAESDEVRKRFLREARATAQIRSPHVVEVFEHGLWDGLPFIVMELLEGEELAKRLDRVDVLDPDSAYSVVAQVARALAHAHALGIVHRDLKPENVFLVPADGGEIVKVLDFGIAHHALYSPRDRATQAGAVFGTPCYMSPEQALGNGTDWRSDLWALGVVAFECLTGKLPFFHDALGGLLTQILHEPIPPIRGYNPALPVAVEAWWQRASAREPERRFQTAAELSDELARALGVSEPLTVPNLEPCSEAHRIDAMAFDDASQSAAEFAVRLGSDAPVAMDTGEIITQFRRKVRRRSVWRWGAVVAVVSGLVGLGVWLRGRVPDLYFAPRADVPALVEPAPARPGPSVAVPSSIPPPPTVSQEPASESPLPESSPPDLSSLPESESSQPDLSSLQTVEPPPRAPPRAFVPRTQRAVPKSSFDRVPQRYRPWPKPEPPAEPPPKTTRDYGI
jgi:serine/threonine protein kinase